MQIGRCCQCDNTTKRAVTLKRFSASDGSTVWEYGPGVLWSHHYGADQISGLVLDLSGTLDKYVVSPNLFGGAGFPNRNSVTLSPNCYEAMTITKLSSTDGSVVESATLEGVFATGATSSSVALIYGLPDSCALSGGDLVVMGPRLPQVELNDYSTNPTTKSYTFHAHTQQAGNITLTTRVSGHTITLAYNTSAASAKTAIETSADVSSATVTGGPWPHAKLSVSVTWTSSSGDFATISVPLTYTVGAGPSTTTRNAFGTLTTYDTGTGLINSSIGYVFGIGSGKSFSPLVSTTDPTPLPAQLAAGFPLAMAAGASNRICVQATATTNPADNASVEAWTVGSTWTNAWTKWNNLGGGLAHTMGADDIVLMTTSPKVSFNSGGKFCNAVNITIASGSTTEHDDTLITTSSDQRGTRRPVTGSAGSGVLQGLTRVYTSASFPNLKPRFHLDGEEYDVGGGTTACLGLGFFASDGTRLVGSTNYGVNPNPSFNIIPPTPGGATIGGSIAKAYIWTFLTPTTHVWDTGTEFRIWFRRGNATLQIATGWMDWHISEADLKTELIATLGENTEGVVSNVIINPLGSPSALLTTNSVFELNLQIWFSAATTFGFVSPARVSSPGYVTIETRTTTLRYSHGLSCVAVSDGSVTWSRAWGTSSANATTVENVRQMWIRSGAVYAYGEIVDTDF